MTAPATGRAACGRCRNPFDPSDPASDGRARSGDSPFCRSCVDRCHESTDFAHTCMICVPRPDGGEGGSLTGGASC